MHIFAQTLISNLKKIKIDCWAGFVAIVQRDALLQTQKCTMAEHHGLWSLRETLVSVIYSGF